MQSIYGRIEALIKQKGMTKKSFCEQLNISTGNFGDWKRGKSTPSTNKLIEISSFFGVSPDWLILCKEPEPYMVKEQQDPYLWENGRQLNEMPLSDHEKEFIKEYIKFVEYRKNQSRDQ